jgi:hypothetical protein
MATPAHIELEQLIKEHIEANSKLNPFDLAFCEGVREIYEQLFDPPQCEPLQSPEQA